MNRFIGFVLRILSLILIGLIAMSRSIGIPVWGSVLMLVASFALFFFSAKMMK